tara:strand:+ start:1167 stop:1358 length:192 start_codon:yes stop_codon:yes gene_type:complete
MEAIFDMIEQWRVARNLLQVSGPKERVRIRLLLQVLSKQLHEMGVLYTINSVNGNADFFMEME